MPEIRVLVVDNHPLVRDGTTAAIDQAPGMEVVGVAGSGAEALKLIDAIRSDVLLLDLRLPDMSGLEVARQTQARQAPIAIVALTGHESPVYVRTLAELGASAFLSKTATGEEIVATIRAVAAGNITSLSATIGIQPSSDLSRREDEVLRLLARGRHNHEIAADLYISAKTVEFHLRHIFTKLGVRSRTEAATRARQLGLLD